MQINGIICFVVLNALFLNLKHFNVLFLSIFMFCRALALHITTKRIPMLQQLREGLEIYNLIKVMQKKPQECHDLFVIGYDDKVCRNSVLSILVFFCIVTNYKC